MAAIPTEVRFVAAIPKLASLDVERSLTFFERLGFQRLHTSREYGVARRDGVSVHFWLCSDPGIPRQTGCRISVEGIDVLFATYSKAGVIHPNGRLEAKPWGSREFSILDMDGNLVTFSQAAKDARSRDAPAFRKQYHFRPSERGLRAWDVDRLIAATAHLEPESVPIASFGEIDEPYWGAMTCRQVAEHAGLIEECDLGFPIILSSDGRVMDGMHRVLKALMRGDTHIRAVRFSVDPEPDYVGVGPEDLPYER